MRPFSFKWRGGYLVLRAREDAIVLTGGNVLLTLSPRELSIRGPVEGIREHVIKPKLGNVGKTIYIDMAFDIRGVERPEGTVFSSTCESSVGGFGVAYTIIAGLGEYLTLHPPPGSLYEAVTVAAHTITLFTLERRQVYFMEEDREKKLILV